MAPDHDILEGRYRSGAWKTNRVRVEGPGILTESFAWEEIKKYGDILEMVEDLNLTTTASAHDRGDAYLRQAEIESIYRLYPDTGELRPAALRCGRDHRPESRPGSR